MEGGFYDLPIHTSLCDGNLEMIQALFPQNSTVTGFDFVAHFPEGKEKQ